MKMDDDSSMIRDAAEIKGIEHLDEVQCGFYDDVLRVARESGLDFAIG